MRIQELVVELSKVNKMSTEDKKAVARILSLLFNRTELLDGLAWCFGEFENTLLESNNDSNWNPIQKEFEMKDRAVYQEDRFGVPCEVLRYEEKYPKMDKVKATYVIDPSVPF